MSELNIAKAVRSNAVFASHLHWARYYGRILATISISSPPDSAAGFVEKLAAWQGGIGRLRPDGMLGPKTWKVMRPRLENKVVTQIIPNWLRSPVAQGWRQAIIHTLRQHCSFLQLTNATHRIIPADFLRVAEMIEKDHISIVATRGRSNASYEFRNGEEDANSIKTPHRAGKSIRYSQGLIVHEACHAIGDLKGRKQAIFDEEMTAYVVQQMFLQKFKVPPSEGSPAGRVIHAAAAPLAAQYLGGETPRKAEWEALKEVLRKHPSYAGKEQTFPFLKFDGVNPKP